MKISGRIILTLTSQHIPLILSRSLVSLVCSKSCHCQCQCQGSASLVVRRRTLATVDSSVLGTARLSGWSQIMRPESTNILNVMPARVSQIRRSGYLCLHARHYLHVGITMTGLRVGIT
ncbi:hypothetical protein F5Y18DRAFT_385062 [Xylariaceae sp. FL1019]|nr:hypothetical protein F5Y18DRAFT_385062 [Xylariaceae sp. FL1019]